MCSNKKQSVAKPRNVLPLDPKPVHYKLRLRPDLTAFTFTGHVAVTLQASKPVETIVFNCIELSFQSGRVTGPGGYEASFAGAVVALDEPNMRGSVKLAQAAPAGELTLELTYSGLINDKLHGFYRSKVVVGEKVQYLGRRSSSRRTHAARRAGTNRRARRRST